MIITRDGLNEEYLEDRKNKFVVFTSGVFDLLHCYHLLYLERCKKVVKRKTSVDITLVVGVDSDDFVLERKKKRPIITYPERLLMVHALKLVDHAFLITGVEYLIEMLNSVVKPDYMISNGQFGGDHISKYLDSRAELIEVPDISGGYSTSDIIQGIKSSDVSSSVYPPQVVEARRRDTLSRKDGESWDMDP